MTLENGSKELSHVATEAHPGAGCPQAEGSRSAARRGDRVAGGVQAARGVRADVLPVAQPVRRDEGRGREAAEGARGGEREAEADRRRSGPREPGAEGDRKGKLVSPSRRRQAVLMLQDRLGLSERRACRYVGQPRSTQRREPVVAEDDAALRVALRAVSRAR